ncbi:MAG: TraR/DksA C4-type zinc finger protein [Candidatus Magasanikbacteria bacterium]|nr:TraR/DksA C4-type zinc finger protein [Candidatus Magasanikbacteria bacterium]
MTAATKVSPTFLKHAKALLLEEKGRLELELDKLGKNRGEEDATFPDYGDKEDENAAEVAEYAANLSLEQDLEKALRDVIGALARIEKGTYGVCKYCKKPIEERRLTARPTSSACVDCKKAITQEV